MSENKWLTSEYLASLYSRKEGEEIILLDDAPGITIIKKYPAKYNKDDYRMFVRFYVLEGKLIYGWANMMEERTKYIREDKNFTNFSLDDSDKIIFDVNKDKIVIKRWGIRRNFTVNQFVDLLTKNHLHNKYLRAKLVQKMKFYFLKLIFWLVDKKYDWADYQDEIDVMNDLNRTRTRRTPQPISIPEIQEPFFKYFHIYRKILLMFMIFLFTVILSWLFVYLKSLMCWQTFMVIFQPEYFTVANPILLLVFFLSLSGLHYFSEYLTKQFSNTESFIVKMHYSLLSNKFKLKIY